MNIHMHNIIYIHMNVYNVCVCVCVCVSIIIITYAYEDTVQSAATQWSRVYVV
jgi:lipoprotein signal peptidase